MNMFLRPSASQVHYWILQGLILLGFFFHQVEDWRDRTSAYVIIAVLIGFVFLEKYRQWIFLIFISYALYRYALMFPNLANHSNLNFFLLLLMLPAQIQLTVFRSQSDFMNLIRSFRLTVVLLYFFTIFHKLNWDFLNPDTSCANDKLGDYLKMIPPQYFKVGQWVRTLNPYMGWLIEGIIPLSLTVGRWRKFGILFLVVLHFILAPMGFTDFSSLAMAFAWVFVVRETVEPERTWRHFQWLVGASLVMELAFAPWRFARGIEVYSFAEGILFALIYAPFLFIYCRNNIYSGTLKLPRFVGYNLFLILFFLFGFSNYLGLRTAGTFSMFSNLQTEGKTSNHILLSSNPFKIWDFQEDVVEIVDVHPSIQGFYRHMPYPGQKIPVVEFARLIDKMKGRSNSYRKFKVIYNGEVFETEDAVFDEDFRFDVPWWQKKFLKFRLIQGRGPQICHW